MEKHPVDLHVGEKILQLRKKRQLNQNSLADRVGTSRQLIQKYEVGEARVSVGVLHDISKALNVEISYFVDGIDNIDKNNSPFQHDLIPKERTKPLNVLLVEDSVSEGFLTRSAIDQCEHDVSVCSTSDGVETLKFLRNQKKTKTYSRPDIILLDLNIPRKGGMEVLKEIKSDKELKNIPVVVITNSVSNEEMQQVYLLGGSGYVVKPFHPKKFFATIESIINYWVNMALPSM